MFQKFSKKKSVQKSGSPKSRALRLENLENRELLSVTTFEAETAVAFEAQTFAPAPNAEALDLATLVQGAATETPSLLVTTATDDVDATDGEISLREAILYAEADASLGGVVTFDSALQGETLVLSGAQLDISSGVKIDASSLWDAKNDAPGLTIDANAKSRIFGVSGGTEAAPVELVALALINGLAADGGAVNASGVVAFENCSIKNNVSSERGGGVYAAAGFATFENCEFVGNVAASNGGVYIYDDGATEI